MAEPLDSGGDATPRAAPSAGPGRVGGRRWLQRALILAAVAVGAVFAARELRDRALFVEEIDARIVGDLVTVSSRVSGWLTELNVDAGDAVTAGMVVARIDARESRLLLAELEAKAKGIESEVRRSLAERELIDRQTRSRLDTQLSTANAAQATAAALDPQLELARSELARAESLFRKRVIAKQQLDQARATARRIEGEHRASRAEYEEAKARLDEARADRARLNVLDEELQMLAHRKAELDARLAQQQLDLEDRVIRSPLAGVVDKTFVEVGEYVRPGQRLVIVHDPRRVWVEANIKETEIDRLEIGQPVAIEVDAYPRERFTGRVQSIGTSTTASYALLPNPNPSGNFTKITQRLPVRIAVDGPDQRLHPGMMVEVRIDVRER